MASPTPSELGAEPLQTLFFFLGVTLLTHWLAWRAHFFTLQLPAHKQTYPHLTRLTASAFAIYIALSLFIVPIAAKILLATVKMDSQMLLLGYMQLFVLSATTLCFVLLGLKHKNLMRTLWKDPRISLSSIAQDIGMGLLTWLISFPLIILIGQLADLILSHFFSIEAYEQVAVRYFKMTLKTPSLFYLALISILLFAPFVEEFLFRGLLQTWIKHKLGRASAIFFSSICFGIFHLAGSQGMGNIPLFLSLFALGCYLGFLYEKQGSLFASISLHTTFNAISIMRILMN